MAFELHKLTKCRIAVLESCHVTSRSVGIYCVKQNMYIDLKNKTKQKKPWDNSVLIRLLLVTLRTNCSRVVWAPHCSAVLALKYLENCTATLGKK